MSIEKNEAIAIIGIGCRFPGDSDTPKEFWNMLMSKTDAICDVPENRWDSNSLYDPDWKKKGKISVNQGGFISNIDKFDASFFGIPPIEAMRMDPQQRMLLEGTYMAMEDAGVKVETLDGSRTGVFIGLSAHDYGDLQQAYSERENLGAQSMQGGASSIASNRISYVFNFKGPSFTVDTACSSSLVALHLAIRSIRSGESDISFVGGVNAIIKPEPEMAFSKGGFLSPDCRCKAFDADANGYIRSEGMGIVMLKPLSKALEDGDKIYTTVIGSAINEDGRTPGLAMPNYDSQVEVLRDAYKDAGISPGLVDYVEAHGTGTAVGDPIELRSIGTVIGSQRDEKVYVGSVKSNIGHLEPASGMAGLIKLSLSMKNRTVPPNIHFNKPNPKIDFKELNVEVPVDATGIGGGKEFFYAGINSFGFGGANAHAVLKSAPSALVKKKEKSSNKFEIFTLSARGSDARKELASDYIEALANSPESLESFAYSAGTRRSAHDHRVAICADSKESLIDNLRKYMDGYISEYLVSGRKGIKENNKTAFVFSGQGPQWFAMGRELLSSNSVFAETVAKIDRILENLGWLGKEKSSLRKELEKDENDSRINETEIAQPAIFALQVGLTEVLRSMGILPDAIVGHSIGEVAASYASGALTLEEATKVVFWRSRCQASAAGLGKMCAIGVSEEEARKLLKGREDRINLAAVNGPAMVTVSGDNDALDKLGEELEAKGTFYRFLIVDVPFHSYLLESIKDDFISSIGKLKCAKGTIPLYSTVTAKTINGKKLDGNYWYGNIRQSVLFYPAIKEMINDGCRTFIEIGPHPILSKSIKRALDEAHEKGATISTLRRNMGEELEISKTAAELFCWGYDLNWDRISAGNGSNIELPAYPWQKEAFWLETEEGEAKRKGTMVHPHLMSLKTGSTFKKDQTWDIFLDKRKDTYIEDHRVQGPLVYPGAGHVELAISCGLNSFENDFEFLEDINFKSALFLPDDGQPPHIQLEITGDEGSYSIATKQRSENSEWAIHSNGRMNHTGDKFYSVDVSLDEVRKRTTEAVNLDTLFEELYAGGLLLGDTFKGMKKLHRNDDEAISEIHLHKGLIAGFGNYNVHPAILDACFQTAFGIHKQKEGELMGVYIPVHIDRIKFFGKAQTHLITSYARKITFEDEFIIADIWIFDSDGNKMLEIQGFKAQYLKGSKGEVAGEMDNWFYAYEWKRKERRADELIREPGKIIPSPLSAEKEMDSFITNILKRPINRRFLDEFEPELDHLTWTYIIESLSNMGFDFSKGNKFSPEELKERFSVVERHERLFFHMLSLLAKAGYFSKGKKGWTVLRGIGDREASDLLVVMKYKYPEFSYELDLLGRCGPYIKEVLIGTIDPIGLIFPENDWESVIDYYTEGHSFKKYNEMVQFGLKRLIKDFPENKVLRVLEVGAGTGGMSQAVLPVLPGDRTEYHYTDVSLMFSVKARERFNKYPFIQYSILDIEKDPAAQGFDLHSFDIIVASDVLHATKDIKETMTNVKKLLAPQGLVLMLEVTNTPIYLDLIFGMTEGWWMYQDTDLRKNHCTMPLKTWMPVLEELQFTDILPVTDVKDGSRSSQTVFMMRTPSQISEAEKVDKNQFKAEIGQWIVFEDNRGVGKKIGSRLEKLGNSILTVKHGHSYKEDKTGLIADPENREHFQKILEKGNKMGNLKGIVHFWSLDSAKTEEMNAASLEESQSLGCLSTLNLVKELVAQNPDNSPVLWLVTAGAENVEDDADKLALAQSPLWGLTRVIINEHPSIPAKIIDISSDLLKEELDQLFFEISSSQPVDRREEELAFRKHRRYSHKFARVNPSVAIEEARKDVDPSGSLYRLETIEPGNTENLVLRERTLAKLGGKEVSVAVKASALNFRDVMMAMGMLSDEAVEGGLFGKNFGLEYSGIVMDTGDSVNEFKPGDKVMGFSSSSIAGRVHSSVDHLVHMPETLSFNEASTIPMVYLTAWYSLNYLCRMRKGERVLIHAAAGGVGIAAIKMAQLFGAEVFATCSKGKADFVRSLGVDHIYDSHSLTFHDEVKRDTNGEGVDIVLNSIAGTSITQSIKSLASYGRFVEIGKVDIYNNKEIGLKPFGNNLSYFAVDIDRLLKQKPSLAKELMNELMVHFYNGDLEGHPYKEFKVSRSVDAFKYLARSKQIGKVVVSMDEDNIKVSPSRQISFKKDATYMIVGGCGGFGLAVAQWMVRKGALNLALVSRSGIKTREEETVVQLLIDSGINVEVMKADATSEKDVESVLDYINRNMAPLKGIIQSAMVLDDNMLVTMEKEKFMKVIRPKVNATWILHQKTKDLDLDYFVPFSSIAALYGTPGQSNYAASNVFLDKFSFYRRAIGLKGSTINWGVLGEVGFVARTEKVDTILANQGWKKFSLRQSTDCMEKILLLNRAQTGAISAEWDKVKDSFPHNDSSLRFTHLFHENDMGSLAGGNEKSAIRDSLIELDDKERQSILEGHLQDTVAKILGASRDKIDKETSVTKMGLDSLMANQLRTWIHNNTGVDYSLMRIMQGPGISDLGRQILEMFSAGSDPGKVGEKASIDKWIVRTVNDEAKHRLFCFSYLGGGASLFNNWNEELDDVEVCMVQLPGREERIEETPVHDNTELSRILCEHINELSDKPFSFYGHSFGGGLAFEVTKDLEMKHNIKPEKLIIGAAPAPHVNNPLSNIFNNVDGSNVESIPEESVYSLLDALKIEDSFTNDKDLMDKMMPAMKADIVLMRNKAINNDIQVECPVVIVAGDQDHVYPKDSCLKPWEKYSDNFSLVEVEGGHFFLKEEKGKEQLLSLISNEIIS